MSKEQNPSYVMNEEISHSEKHNDHQPPHNSGEALKSFHHNVSHLDEMIKKVNSLEKNAVKNTDTVNILNNLLQKSGLGGSNGGSDSKAYFTRHGDHIVLVLNTVVDGKKLTSIGDIEKMLEKVDGLLIKNPIVPSSSPEKKEIAPGEKIQRANKRLTQYESQIHEMNASYRESVNDWFMVRDSFAEATGLGESGKKIYENSIKSTQKYIEEDYRTLLTSFVGKELGTDDIKRLTAYRVRAEELLGRKLEDVQSFAGYVLTERKMASLKSAGHALNGMVEGAFEAFTGTAVFLFLYSTNPILRDEIHASVGSFYDYLKENCTDYDTLWKDFLKALDKEFTKIQQFPPEKQAEMIGKITGNIMATIIGAKAMNALMKSGKLRIKFKSPEIANPASPRNISPSTLFKAVESVDDKALVLKKRPKIIHDIGEVKNFADLESFVNTIDRIRFKEGVTGKMIQEIINGVRQGTRKINEIPDYGGLRKTVQKLVDNGGIIPDPVVSKWKPIRTIENTMTSMKGTVKTGMNDIKNTLPFKEARKFLGQQILTGYDHIDIGITKLRTLTNVQTGALGDAIVRASHIREMRELTEKTMESIRAVPFPGKEALLNNLEKFRASLISLKDGGISAIDTVDQKVANLRGKLSKKEFQNLRFDEGLAVREIKGKDGTILYEYRGVDGKKLLDEYTYASHFKDGRASVTTKDGKNLTINTKGEVISNHAEVFSSIERFENGGYRVFEDGQYRIVYPEGHKGSTYNSDRWRYSFMTEIHGEMVIGVDKRGVKYIIDQNRKRFRAPFHYVDDFTDHGVAAIQEKPNGKWLLIDKEGNLIRKDGSIIRATGEVVDKNGITLNKKGKKGGNGGFDEQMAKEAREAAFREEGHTTNLEAIKSHLDKKSDGWNPELIRKIEADAIALLKKHRIDVSNPMFSHTRKEGILLFEDPVKGSRLVNLMKGTVSKETFSYVHTPDIEKGFARVSSSKGAQLQGVVDLDGKYIIDPKYIDIQIHDDIKGLFEVSEMRKVGEVLDDGMVISPHFLDTPGSSTVKRIGLVDSRGKTLIETGYTEITKTNDTISQGLIRSEKHQTLYKSKGLNTERYSMYSTALTSTNFDTASFVAMTATELPTGGKVGGKTINILRNETSTIVAELKESRLSLLFRGESGVNDTLTQRIRLFLTKNIPACRDIGTLKTEIGKLVHEETSESVRKYLKENGLPRLTKAERIEVANYEKEIQEKLVGTMQSLVQSEGVPSKRNNLSERGSFMTALIDSLHPDVYKSFV